MFQTVFQNLLQVKFVDHQNLKMNLEKPFWFNFALLFLILLFLFFPFKTLTKNLNSLSLFNQNFTNSLRGLAIVWVILHHLSRQILQKPLQMEFFFDGYVSVALFLVLSGFGLSESLKKKNLDLFFYKKLLRIYLPFLIVNIMILLLHFFVQNKTFEKPEFYEFLFGLKLLDSNLWYIKYILFCYVQFFVLTKLIPDRNTKILVYLITAIVSVVFGNLINAKYTAFAFGFGVFLSEFEIPKLLLEYQRSKQFKTFYQLFFGIILFLSGVFLYRLNFLNSSNNPNRIETQTPFSAELLLLLFFVIFAFISSFFNKKLANFWASGIFVILGFQTYFSSENFTIILFNLSAVLIIIGFAATYNFFMQNKISIIFDFLGKISFEIYLLHGTFMRLFDFILFRGKLDFTFWIYLLFIIFLSWILHLFSNFLIKLFKPDVWLKSLVHFFVTKNSLPKKDI
jgi:probable poly-beta-1,6-N-acetyl-D-glucosamine export protein